MKTTTQILAASFFGVAASAAAAAYYRRGKFTNNKQLPTSDVKDQIMIPRSIRRTESGRHQLERFSHFVARQLGFRDADECPLLGKLAIEYLRKSKECEESIYDYLGDEEDVDSLYVMLVEEFERCILAYFAFHWSQASIMISQVFNVESEEKKRKLKDLVLAATRKQRFARVTKNLKVTRVFSTLVEEIKLIGGNTGGESESCMSDVMVPVAHSERSPVLLLMGGVVVEADAFKESDVIYRALSSMGHHNDMLQTAELVHQSSTDAASSLLVTALNEGRDVIMDGTLSWVPFVEQTIAMARNVHKCRYRMGVGYKVAEDGTITENYWEQVNEEEEVVPKENGFEAHKRKPYRVERAIMVGRAVRVNSQLTSHKRFASAFEKYCHLVDNARLYSTNSVGGPPKLIGWKDGANKLLVDTEEIECLKVLSSLNSDAESIYELYADPDSIFQPGSIWNDIVLSPSRPEVQQRLKDSIQKIELIKSS
ncbi:hypothetical protein TIFTF001_022625 [Ficus carica]|uniref:Uncharacterized protein n=1 Tax=Ficus carica TaxID=3494 RepID=A0AA88ATS9_FICCA|nr:hypothetical protein TIFTF001_022625 [Ficus carica]